MITDRVYISGPAGTVGPMQVNIDAGASYCIVCVDYLDKRFGIITRPNLSRDDAWLEAVPKLWSMIARFAR